MGTTLPLPLPLTITGEESYARLVEIRELVGSLMYAAADREDDARERAALARLALAVGERVAWTRSSNAPGRRFRDRVTEVGRVVDIDETRVVLDGGRRVRPSEITRDVPRAATVGGLSVSQARALRTLAKILAEQAAKTPAAVERAVAKWGPDEGPKVAAHLSRVNVYHLKNEADVEISTIHTLRDTHGMIALAESVQRGLDPTYTLTDKGRTWLAAHPAPGKEVR